MWQLTIDNIGGIRSGQAEINKGNNIVQASNFQGKSSLIRAIQTVMGTTGVDEPHPLTEGEREGKVTLKEGEEDYKVELKRDPKTIGKDGKAAITRSGNTYLTDPQDITCARLFAFLGETNPIRLAVRNQDWGRLTELLQQPLEEENLDERIDVLAKEKYEVREDIRKIEKTKKKLPKKQEEVTQTEKKLEELREKKEELEGQVTENSEQKELRDELTSTETELGRINSNIERLERDLSNKKEKLEEKKEQLENLEIPSEVETSGNIKEKEEEITNLKSQIQLLRDLYSANDSVFKNNELALVTDIDRGIDKDEFVCWVSGDKTTKEDVKKQLAKLEETRQSLKEKKKQIEAEVKETKEKKKEISKKERKKDQLESSISRIKTGIVDTESDIKEAKKQQEKVSKKLEEIKEEYEETEQSEEEKSQKLTQVQTEIGQKENALKSAKRDLEKLEEKTEGLDELKKEEKQYKEELQALRDRRRQVENEIEDQFSDTMSDIIEKFAPGFKGANLIPKRKNGEKADFEITVGRDGSETNLDNLSEGEVELVGVVTALAGYRAFNVNERVPCILIDGIGQLASEHIHNLTDYLEDASEVVITTAYPEAEEFKGNKLSPDEWDVVSDQEVTPA